MPYNNCCLCYPTVCSNPTPTTPRCPAGECLYLPHLLVGSENSVGPCGETGFIPFADTGLDTTLCGATTPTFSIISKSPIFTNVTITSSGVTFTTTTALSSDSVGIIEYGVGCGNYSTISSITIILKNLCAGIVCPQGQRCESCSGDCVNINGDLIIGERGPVTGGGGLSIG
jgi:hypothetical protein